MGRVDYNLLAAWAAAFEEGLFDFGLGGVFGSGRELFEVGWRGGCEWCCCGCPCCCGERLWEEEAGWAAEEREKAGKGPDHGGGVCGCVEACQRRRGGGVRSCADVSGGLLAAACAAPGVAAARAVNAEALGAIMVGHYTAI